MGVAAIMLGKIKFNAVNTESFLVSLFPGPYLHLFIFAGHNLNEIPVMLLQMIHLRSDVIMLHLQEALQLSAGKLV